MKIWEAIREGCRLRPKQAFRSTMDAEGNTCALGAAMHGIGRHPDAAVMIGNLHDAFPEINGRHYSQCPDCGQSTSSFTLPNIIAIHLNDKHKWSRERIADWLEAELSPPIAVTLPKEEPIILNIPKESYAEKETA